MCKLMAVINRTTSQHAGGYIDPPFIVYIIIFNMFLSLIDHLQGNHIHVTLEITESFTFLSIHTLKCDNMTSLYN
jgi:hypothetical protein